MTYARAIDVNIYVKRDFKPLEDRVRDIVTIEDQAANIMTAGKTNLAAVLPKPYVELAIQIANGSADFLEKDLVAAVKDVNDEPLDGGLSGCEQESSRGAARLRGLADEREAAESDGRISPWVRPNINDARRHRVGRSSAGQDSRDRSATFEGRAGGFRRRRQDHRSEEEADRRFQGNPE